MEIKEILDKLKDREETYQFCKQYKLAINDWVYEAHYLLDYITNLQQENERLKELVNPKTQIFIDTQDMEEKYGEELYKEYLEKQVKDYKSRTEKAVEYIKEQYKWIEESDKRWQPVLDNKKILNILNGRSDE